MKVLITCPPMIRQLEEFRPLFAEKNVEVVTPNTLKALTEDELVELVPTVDAWIIGDDPATRRVFEAGKAGRLRAAVKWGVGIENVDFAACRELRIPITNTPQQSGAEVATIAVAYVLGLARETYLIDREVRQGCWPNPAGISLAGCTVALIGFGDIGKATARYLRAFEMHINVYDLFAPRTASDESNYHFLRFPERLEAADFVVTTCALTSKTKYLINAETISRMKDGVRIINVSRGGIVDESALIEALKSGKVHSAGLDVFETEPLPMDSELRQFDRCILGTHNGPNTLQGVRRASLQALRSLFQYLELEVATV